MLKGHRISKWNILHGNALFILNLQDSHVLAHQPYEMIFLSDSITDTELEELAMLQKKSLVERASAPLLQSSPDDIMLL